MKILDRPQKYSVSYLKNNSMVTTVCGVSRLWMLCRIRRVIRIGVA